LFCTLTFAKKKGGYLACTLYTVKAKAQQKINSEFK